MSTGQIIDAAPNVQEQNRQQNPIPGAKTPDPATVDDIVEMLTRWQPRYTRLIVESFRHLWDRGELRELAALYKAVHAKYISEIESRLPEPYDREDKSNNKCVLDMARKRIYELLSRATGKNGKVLQPYLRETLPLTDEQRKHFGRLWEANEEKLRIRAKLIDPNNEDELLSDTVARLVKRDVFETLAPDYDAEHFLFLAYRCMRMAHRKERESKRRRRYNVGRYLLRKGKADAVRKSRSRVVEYVERMEALSILLQHIAKLSDRKRDAVISYYLDGESSEDIARRWDRGRGYPMGVCHKGLDELREVVSPSLDPGGYTPQQATKRMAALRDRGETWSAIGDKFGITRNSVVKRVQRLRKESEVSR